MKNFKRTLWLPIFILMLSLGFGNAVAQNTEVKSQDESAEAWQYHDIVDVDFVQQYAKVPQPKGVMIIDARPYKPKYIKGHIPTAVNIPDSKFDKMVDQLPQDKETLLIFYCGGFTWKLSHKSARKAEKLGYTNVKVFAAGYPVWLKTPGNYASVSAEYVAKKIEANEITLIDARPYKPKYVKGHIPTAISIPDSKFDKMVDQLPQDKEAPLVFYCGGHTCKLSHKSAQKAIALGYSNVKVFSAGYPGWKEYAGEAENKTAISIKKGKEEGSIDIATFKKIITEKPDSIVLIDSRDADEFKIGSIKTAVNIPVDRLEQELKTMVVDKPIVFICSTGARSGESYYMVQDLRPSLKEVYYLDAKVMFNSDGSYEIQATES